MKIGFITGNKGKFDEMKRVRPDIDWEMLDMDLPEIQSLDSKEIISAKLDTAMKVVSDRVILVEDTSLVVAGLNGLPGPFIKWFYKTLGNEKLASIAIASGDSSAVATVTIGVWDGINIEYFEGQMIGKIVTPRGKGGFGWDQIFEVQGSDKTWAEMNSEEQNQYSMRKKALEKFNI